MEISFAFTLIFALIVLGIVLFFGSDVIQQLLGLTGDAQFVNQVTEIQKLSCGQARDDTCSAGLFWSIVGDTRPFKLSLPGGFSKICFLDSESDLSRSTDTWDGSDHLVNLAIQGKKQNIYGLKSAGENLGFKIPKLKPNQNFCVDKNTDLLLTAKGQYVEVSEQV